MLKTLRAPSRQSCTIWLVKVKPPSALSADKEEVDVVKVLFAGSREKSKRTRTIRYFRHPNMSH